MKLTPLSYIDISQNEQLQKALQDNGNLIILLNGDSIFDLNSFFIQAAQDIPQPIEMKAVKSLDALRDNIIHEFGNLAFHKISFIWNHAEIMLENDIVHFKKLIDFFIDLANDFSNPPSVRFPALAFTLILSGTGDRFYSYCFAEKFPKYVI